MIERGIDDNRFETAYAYITTASTLRNKCYNKA